MERIYFEDSDDNTIEVFATVDNKLRIQISDSNYRSEIPFFSFEFDYSDAKGFQREMNKEIKLIKEDL